MYKLILADGTQLACDWCAAREGVLSALVRGVGFAQAFQTFMATAKTSRIVFDFGESSRTYLNYTSLLSVMVQDGGILVQLREAE